MIKMQLIKGGSNTITGALEYAPELRYTASGKPLCTFRIIYLNGIKSALSCEAWEKIGENIIEADYKSQNIVTITGYHKTREYKGGKHGYFVVKTCKFERPF